MEPIKCPKCGAIVKVTTVRFPDCEWECLMCGEKGSIKSVFGTKADGNTAIGVVPAWSVYANTNTRCIICDEEFKFDGAHRICPKCREAIIKLRGTADSTANAMPADKSTVTDTKSTACDIPEKPSLQQGWECPKCGAILAPYMPYCPFCSKKESDLITTVGTGTQPFYGEWTNRDNLTPPTGQYTNPNPSTTISLGVKPKKSDNCSSTLTFGTPCDIRTWKLEQ